jgi:hypothetical protein
MSEITQTAFVVPEKFKDDLPAKPPGVPVPEAESDLNITKEEGKEIATAIQAMAIPDAAMRMLQKLGAQVDSRGAISIAHGFTFLTAQAALKVLLQLAEGVDTPARAFEYAHAVGYISRALAGVTANFKGAIIPGAPSTTPNRPMAFPAGERIAVKETVTRTVEYGGQAEKSVNPTIAEK